jgi:hypothetical protein
MDPRKAAVVKEAQEFAKQERDLITAYLVAYMVDVSKSFQLCEASYASNITVHFAVAHEVEDPLSSQFFDSLGEQAQILRDKFMGQAQELCPRCHVRNMAIAVQLLQNQACLGIIPIPMEKKLELLSAGTQIVPMELFIP